MVSVGDTYRCGLARATGRRPVSYGFAHRDEQGALWPMHEARIQTGAGVDKYGDPDLMADFAKEYLKQHWMLLQPGRLPQTLVEVMPSLLLLVTAAELAMKAFTLRSRGEQPRTHDLVDLYDGLDSEHQATVESQFGRCQLVVGLRSIGADAPKVQHILGTYADIYGGKRGAYQEAKFYAEPTTMLPGGSDLRGREADQGKHPVSHLHALSGRGDRGLLLPLLRTRAASQTRRLDT